MFTGLFLGCQEPDDRVQVRIWHQKIGAERVFFERAIDIYNESNPDRYVEILYKETEELRNLYIVASAGGQGPELIYSPADNLSIFALTKTIRPISDALSADYLSNFGSDGVLSWEGEQLMVADQVGNHLTLVYNRALIPEPPSDFDELITVLQALTVDEDGDGRIDRYGLTWNYTEPFFFMPFLTGFGGWMMDEEGNPTLNTPETIKAIQFILDLRDKYKVIPERAIITLLKPSLKNNAPPPLLTAPGHGEGMQMQVLIMAWQGFLAYQRRVTGRAR